LMEISIDKLFNQGNRYVVPIYQRNYAWDDFDREQLLEDIMDYIETDDEYFLGSLIVFEKEDSVYEVIDGQQRLTTLFILLAALQEKVDRNSLTFEARKKSNYTLEQIAKNSETFNE